MPYRNNDRGGFKGGKTFGGGGRGAGAPWKKPSYGGGMQERELFDATCASCNDRCQVPFRPNGSKPVLCRNCFKKDEGGFAPRRDERPSYNSRPSYGAPRPSYGDRPERIERTERPSMDLSKIEARLSAIEAKIDALIAASAESEA